MFLLLDIVVGYDVERLFDAIRYHFATMLQDVIKAILEKNKLEDLKLHLETAQPELEVGLKAVHSYESLISLLRRNCFFTSIHMLKRLAEKFAMDIPEVWKLLTRFEAERDNLYEEVLAKDFVEEAKERARASHTKVMFVCHGSYF